MEAVNGNTVIFSGVPWCCGHWCNAWNVLLIYARLWSERNQLHCTWHGKVKVTCV